MRRPPATSVWLWPPRQCARRRRLHRARADDADPASALRLRGRRDDVARDRDDPDLRPEACCSSHRIRRRARMPIIFLLCTVRVRDVDALRGARAATSAVRARPAAARQEPPTVAPCPADRYAPLRDPCSRAGVQGRGAARHGGAGALVRSAVGRAPRGGDAAWRLRSATRCSPTCRSRQRASLGGLRSRRSRFRSRPSVTRPTRAAQRRMSRHGLHAGRSTRGSRRRSLTARAPTDGGGRCAGSHVRADACSRGSRDRSRGRARDRARAWSFLAAAGAQVHGVVYCIEPLAPRETALVNARSGRDRARSTRPAHA